MVFVAEKPSVVNKADLKVQRKEYFYPGQNPTL